jgi:hypothetical protein
MLLAIASSHLFTPVVYLKGAPSLDEVIPHGTIVEPGTIVRPVVHHQRLNPLQDYKVVEFRPAGSQAETNRDRLVLQGTPCRSNRNGHDIGFMTDRFTIVSEPSPNY